MNIQSNRDTIRLKIKKLRSEQTRDERRLRSTAIMKKLFSVPEFQSARGVAFYSSTQGEVETDQLIDSSLMHGKEISVPKINTKSRTLSFYHITNRSNLRPGRHGILEPHEVGELRVNNEELDMIVVPGIAFDLNCNRLGYGKGYYDSVLRGIETMKVGLAFEFQIVSKIANQKGDVRMDLIITESRLLRPDE